jgi:oligopeptide/dipeptide ABC transporter ATP-binding protein
MSDPLLEVRSLTKVFPARIRGGEPVRAVTDVSFHLLKGETLGLVGESGSGKSTIGQCIVRLVRPDHGQIFIGKRDVAQLSRRQLRPTRSAVQMIFQDPSSSLNPRMTVGDALREALRLRHRQDSRDAIEERLLEMMNLIGLRSEFVDRYPHQMSGGQKQRIGIARALAMEPEIVVADEAVSALDVSIQAQIITLLQSLRKKLGLTILFISHDLGIVRYVADRVAVLYLGRLVEIGKTQDIFTRPRHPYTEALLSAIPSPDRPLDEDDELYETQPQEKIQPSQGCVFAPRCPHVAAPCLAKQPALIEVGAGSGHASACLRQDIYESQLRAEGHADA